MCVVCLVNVFFVVVCTIFSCAVFLWDPKHLYDHGLDFLYQLMCEFNQSIKSICLDENECVGDFILGRGQKAVYRLLLCQKALQ